jgi:hypothetical protein
MSDQTPIDPGHNSTRDLLRAAGIILSIVGGLLLAIGILDFMSSFGSMRMPTLFLWCCFPGMILLGIGMTMAGAGFAGRIARYKSQEVTPVITDTLNYMADETKDSVRQIAGAIGEGLKGVVGTAGTAGTSAVRIRCHKCNHDNDADAGFCSACGAALAKSMPCPNCSELNDADAKFCDNCGQEMNRNHG